MRFKGEKMGKVIAILILVTGSLVHAAGWFGESEYLRCNPDVQRAVYNGQFRSGYDHYVQHGRYEVRVTDGRCFAFDAPNWFFEYGYLNCNPDIRNAVANGQFQSGWHHYRLYGRSENRRYQCN